MASWLGAKGQLRVDGVVGAVGVVRIVTQKVCETSQRVSDERKCGD